MTEIGDTHSTGFGIRLCYKGQHGVVVVLPNRVAMAVMASDPFRIRRAYIKRVCQLS
jgi:hypothetical protein